MLELIMLNVRKHFGDHRVLFDAGFKLYEGDKAGLIGANGSGKSTILKILAGIEPMDIDYRKICEGKSRILYPKGTTLAYLDQLPNYPDGFKVIDVLKSAFRDLYHLEEQLGVLEAKMAHVQGERLEAALKQYSRLQQEYEAKGGYDKEEKLGKVSTGLKFDEAFLQKDFNQISGGEKTTATLGRILLENPDILLLDEPTNHLDMEASEWLESHLRHYKGIVILVSHDRYFLDNVVNKIVEVENKRCETYLGNYSDYTRQKEENLLQQFEDYKQQSKKIHSMETVVKNLRDWAQRADNNKFFRRAVSMQRKLDKMQRVDKPDSGSVVLGANLKIAYLPQIIHFNNEDDTVIECFRENRTILEGKAREYLAKFLFFGKDPYKKVKHLSGGERVRLKLSMLLHDETNLLILDEPTNHLDIDSIEALEEALEDFIGTLLFISHDRFFINSVCTRIVGVEENRLISYPGNYNDYKSLWVNKPAIRS